MQSLFQGCPKQMNGCPVRSIKRGNNKGRAQLQVLAAVKKRSLKNVVCSKTLVAKKAYLEKLKRECKSMSNYGIKSMEDRENGILTFEVFQDPFDEMQIHFFERYEDNVKLGRFNSGDRFTRFMKDVQMYIEKPVGIALYEWDNGRLGSASVQGGPKGEGGLDDATGASGMAAGAGLKQTSGVVNLGDMKRDEGKTAWGMDMNLNVDFKFPWQKDEVQEEEKAK